jgi:hypothetical protein
VANELLTPKLVPDSTYYAVIYNAAGQVFNGTTFEAFTDANYATYDVALTELGTSSGRYAANLPGALSATTLYSYEVLRQVGGSPSMADDVLEAQGELGAHAALVDAVATDLAAAIGALNDISTAEVNTEMVDALTVDTYGEPTGVPAATLALAAKINWMFMALRNELRVSGSQKTFYDDSGAAEWAKTLADDGVTYTESEATTP